jgi:hypothetical protein
MANKGPDVNSMDNAAQVKAWITKNQQNNMNSTEPSVDSMNNTGPVKTT